MRRVLLVIILLGIAFAGGALVNSPYVNKAREVLASLDLGKQFLSKDAEVGEDPIAVEDDSTKPKALPAAPIDQDDSVSKDRAAKPPESDPSSLNPTKALPTEQPVANSEDPLPIAADGSDSPRPIDPETLSVAPPVKPPEIARGSIGKVDHAAAPAAAPAPAPASAPATRADLEPPKPRDRDDWPDVPGSAPAIAAVPKHGSGSRAVTIAPTRETGVDLTRAESSTKNDRLNNPTLLIDPAVAPSAAAGSSTDGGDWGKVRDKMRKLGVSRYTIEGDPNGNVRFRCILPLPGQRSMSQHFEAEGEDVIKAAEVVLKRVALWKASEPAE